MSSSLRVEATSQCELKASHQELQTGVPAALAKLLMISRLKASTRVSNVENTSWTNETKKWLGLVEGNKKLLVAICY